MTHDLLRDNHCFLASIVVQTVTNHPALNLNPGVLPTARIVLVEAPVLVVQFHAVHGAQHTPLANFCPRGLGHNC